MDWIGSAARGVSAFHRRWLERVKEKTIEPSVAVNYFWSANLEAETLTELVVLAVEFLVPAGSSWGHASCGLELLVAHLFVLKTIVAVKKADKDKKPAKWFPRLARLMQPGLLGFIRQGGAALKLFFDNVLSGSIAGGGAVYGFLNRAAVYIGKLVLFRSSGKPGAPARLCEHLRAFLRPASSDGMRGRYRVLRQLGFRALLWLPVVVLSSEAQTFAVEALAIRMEAPIANRADAQQESRLLSRPDLVRRRPRRGRPPKHRRDAKSSTQTIWALSGVLEKTQAPSKTYDEQFPGVLGMQVPYKLLYSWHQIAVETSGGGAGPFGYFSQVHRILLLAFFVFGALRCKTDG